MHFDMCVIFPMRHVVYKIAICCQNIVEVTPERAASIS